MDYVNLGRCGVKVSRLCLGTMNFGNPTSAQESHTIMDHALEVGLNFFDTANVYSGDQRGISEEIIGQWFTKAPQRRDRVVLATKVYCKMGKDINAKRLSAFHIRKACEDSLKRLKTDHIDLYQMHHVDRSTPWEEIWQAMEQLIREGKIIYVGSSNFAAWHIAQGQAFAKERNLLGLVSEQSTYNLTVRDIEREVIPACENMGLGLLPWSPLQGGILAGSVKSDKGRRAEPYQKQRQEKYQQQITQYKKLCEELKADPSQIALAWLLHQKAVTSPIIGPRTLEQFQSNLKSLEVKLDETTLEKIDVIWPGPGNTAPEVYAW